jgi:F420-dependent oxidoreductase-like protein
MARETSTIRLGTLMTSATFRLPGPLAIAVAQVDQMSGGRIELGIGAGWYDAEHAAYAVPFPPTGERFDRLEEQLAILTGLWATPEGETFSYDGTHYPVTDSPGLPKPVQRPHPPIIIGGKGPRRTPALTARYADEFNLPFVGLEGTELQIARVRAACEEIGRDPDGLVWSNAHTICCGADEAEVRRRAERIGLPADELRSDALAGTPEEVVEQIGRYAALGAQRMYLQVLDQHDLDHLRLLAAEVMPHV